MLKTKSMWVIAFLVSVCGYYWYFINYISSNTISVNVQNLKNSVDITVFDLNIKEYNSNGELVNFLDTPRVEHIPNNNIHILSNPHIVIKEDDKAPWEIKSKKAKALGGGNQITFSKDVVICQKPYKGQDEILLFTDEITYFPETKYAFTNKDVKLLQNHNIVQATGLKAYIAENRIQLLSNASGHYEQHKTG